MRAHLTCLGLKILHPLFFLLAEVQSNSNLKACWHSTIASQQEGHGFNLCTYFLLRVLQQLWFQLSKAYRISSEIVAT